MNHNSFKIVTILNTYNLVSVHVFTIDLTYYIFLNFLGDERELLNAILFRQIHTLMRMELNICLECQKYRSMFMICQSTDYITHFDTCCMV